MQSDLPGISFKVTPMCHFKTDIGAAGTNVPIREKAHSGVSPAGAAKNAAQGISLKVLLMQDFQTAASVLKHRLPHSAKPHPRILPQRGISIKSRMRKEREQGRETLALIDHSQNPESVFSARSLLSVRYGTAIQ